MPSFSYYDMESKEARHAKLTSPEVVSSSYMGQGFIPPSNGPYSKIWSFFERVEVKDVENVIGQKVKCLTCKKMLNAHYYP